MQTELTHLDLFSGIGGFSLGLKNIAKTKQFVEIDYYAQRVLLKNFPDVPIASDIRDYTPEYFDIITGGFPCQDISVAGSGLGLSGERSGLWKEFSRVIKESKPKYVIIENSPNLRNKGLETVLEDLWKDGYDAEWYCLEAGQFGAPHVRERLFIIAYPNSEGRERLVKDEYLTSLRQRWVCSKKDLQPIVEDVFRRSKSWPKPLLRGNHDGVSRRVDRIRCVGNSVYPPIVKFLGECIKEDYEN